MISTNGVASSFLYPPLDWRDVGPRTPAVRDASARGLENTGPRGRRCGWRCAEYGAISMGQGQEVHARRLVQQSTQDGSWVLLHNCHLGLDYMDELLDTIITGDSIQSSFRLWLTTEVHTQFPINFLQVSATLADLIMSLMYLLHHRHIA